MRLLRTTSTAAAVCVAALAVAACGGDSSGNSDAQSGAQVKVKTFMFEPDPVRVEPGRRVTWTNEDSTVHTVTTGTRERPDGRVDASLDPSGGKFTTTFDEPGTYRYVCTRHSGPGMEAEVVVE